MDDLISRQGALDALDKRFEEFLRCFGFDSYEKADRSTRLACDGISEAEDVIMGLPSVPPDTYWKEQCQSYERTINKLRESLSAKSETFEWCTDCKEYDQEAHCCHRWSKMIKKTADEMKIVRCKNCKYAEYIDDVKTLWCTECGQGRTVASYDFCSYGERREDG